MHWKFPNMLTNCHMRNSLYSIIFKKSVVFFHYSPSTDRTYKYPMDSQAASDYMTNITLPVAISK
jgi:hypothetical protein